jgi:short-subunit dehydrogenase
MKTTLITGASEGIGYEFAKIFAQNGHDLILVARNENRLLTISQELSLNHKVHVKYYAKDLSKIENAQFIYEEIKSQNITVEYVVNNAGFGINSQYVDIEWERELEMFNLNMITLAYFTKVFAKDMKERGFGRILNLGSTGSFQPGPFMAGYCATKAFVLNLSEAINYELKGSNVHVSTLCPGVTESKFHEVAQTRKTLMMKFLSQARAEDVANYGFKLMMKGKSFGVHGFMNKMMIFSNRFASRAMSIGVAAKLMKAQK